jgi:hypothetical protein
MVAVSEVGDRIEVILERARKDALPEHTQYADTGCSLHPSCLTCPLVRCRYEEPGGTRGVISRGRDQSIVALRRNGLGFEEIARRCGVSRRTVFRALARSKDGRPA